jgi:hypothetical protein
MNQEDPDNPKMPGSHQGRRNPLVRAQQTYKGLDGHVVPTDYVAPPVIHSGPVSMWSASGDPGNHGNHSSHCADNHQNHSDGVNVKAVLIWPYRDREIKNCADGEGDDARY